MNTKTLRLFTSVTQTNLALNYYQSWARAQLWRQLLTTSRGPNLSALARGKGGATLIQHFDYRYTLDQQLIWCFMIKQKNEPNSTDMHYFDRRRHISGQGTSASFYTNKGRLPN